MPTQLLVHFPSSAGQEEKIGRESTRLKIKTIYGRSQNRLNIG